MSTVAARAMGARGKLWLTTSIGLLLALGLISLPLGSWVGHWEGGLTEISRSAVNELIYWALVVLVLGYVASVERRPFSSIGFRRPSLKDLLLGLATGVLAVVMLAVVYLVVFPALHWNENQQMDALTTLPFWLRFAAVVRAAVTEEILFRGYSLERIQELTGSRAIAGLFTWAVFTLDHWGFWGWHHLLVAGSAGALLTLLYLRRRNLWANMLAHFVIDGVGFLLG